MVRVPRPSIACRLVVSVAFLLTLAGCGGNSGGDEKAVRALVEREVAAVNARDMKALAALWSQEPDILLFDVAPPGRFEGWPAIARSFNDLFEKVQEIHMAVDHVRVQVGGRLACATYDWTMSGRLGQATLDDRGEATAIYRREKDGWRLVHAHYSVAPPSEPDASGKGVDGAEGAAGAGPKKPAGRGSGAAGAAADRKGG